jgi:molybdate transport system substrate-binding protein
MPSRGCRLTNLACTGTLMLLFTSCGTAAPSNPAGSAARGERLTVLAAASLTEAFTQIGHSFETISGNTVTFSFGSSATLATQVTQGAPADVFAAASPATMKTVTDASAAGSPVTFVSNTLEIAVPKGNPGHVTGLADFTDPRKKIAICAPEVPCGAAAVTVFAAAHLVAKPDTLEQDVKATLQKVSADEVDAALVYKTDVVAAGDKVEGITFQEAASAVNAYPIAVLAESTHAAAAQAFVAYVLSPAGQAVLTKAGFAKP